jgi:hypothetical protein
MKTHKLGQLIVLLGAALLGGACILQTAAPAAQENVIVVTATPDGGQSAEPEQPSPTFTQELTEPLAPTFTPSLTQTFTLMPVTMTAGQALSCVKGPDWKLYEWVAGIAKDEIVTLVARAVPEIPDYYVVRKANGTECWAFGGSSAISGPTAALPVRETPPPPTVSFVVRNGVYLDLVDVYIRRAGDSAWGADRLTSPSICIGLEASFSITAGYYDVRILDSFGHAMYEAYNRAIGADDNYRILEVAPDVEFTIRNDFPFSVCWIDIQPPGGSWQKLYDTADGGGSIYSGNTRDFTLRAGAYGLKITRCTSAILPASGLYVYPGMPTVVWS